MSDLLIYTTTNTQQTGIVITDKTDWTSLNLSNDSLTSITVSLYQSNLTFPVAQYVLNIQELSSFINSRYVELSFLQIYNTLYVEDGWWTVKITANDNAHESNFSGFGIYADITSAVFAEIDSLHVPEEIKYNAEKYCIIAIYRQGLKFLDTTTVNSREIKYNKRLKALQKMLLKI